MTCGGFRHSQHSAYCSLQCISQNVAVILILVLASPEDHALQACLRLDVDLIYFDLSESLPCKLVISNLAIAIKRGIHFEIDYNPAVRSGDRRTVFFAAAQSKLSHSHSGTHMH